MQHIFRIMDYVRAHNGEYRVPLMDHESPDEWAQMAWKTISQQLIAKGYGLQPTLSLSSEDEEAHPHQALVSLAELTEVVLDAHAYWQQLVPPAIELVKSARQVYVGDEILPLTTAMTRFIYTSMLRHVVHELCRRYGNRGAVLH